MHIRVIRFFNLVFVALVAGTIFGIWIGYDPRSLSPTTYVEQQQSAIRALNVLMPILGLITIALTAVSAYQRKADKPYLVMMTTAAIFLLASGLITRFGNQPINSIVMTWDAQAPPEDWTSFRDQWWFWHGMRTLTAIIGLALVVWANLRKD